MASKKINNTILLNRSLLSWEWYDDTNTVRLWIHLLLRANWKTVTEKGIKIERGELLTSLKSLSNETNMSVTSIRTSIDKLKLTNNITSKTTNKYRIIKVLKYDEYQLTSKQTDNQTNKQTSKQTASKSTTNNIFNEEDELNQLKDTTTGDEEFDKIPYKLIIDYLNEKAKTRAKHTTNFTRKKIQARWNEGFTLNDFKTAIDNAVKFRTNKDGSIDNTYLTPKTLFNGDFENRVNGSNYGWHPEDTKKSTQRDTSHL